MRAWFGVLLVILVLVPAASGQKRRSGPKPPDLEMVMVSCRRAPGSIGVDGRVRNTGEKTVRGLVLVFDFMAPGNSVITTKRGEAEEGVLEPGDEVEFHWQLADHARAVKCRVQAEDSGGRDLRVEKGGPFPIE